MGYYSLVNIVIIDYSQLELNLSHERTSTFCYNVNNVADGDY